MIFERRMIGGEPVFITPDGEYRLRTHERNEECDEYGCVLHNPTLGPMSDFPYNWRTDRGIMERICRHGVGHPDHDSAAFFKRSGMEYENVHGCDGCCAWVNTINPQFNMGDE